MNKSKRSKSDIYVEIGNRIREFRMRLDGPGLSQEALAKKIGVNPNSLSRWETAVYKPSMHDLEKLSEFFKVPIAYFLPESPVSLRIIALLSATHDMSERDLEEVVRYALFRRALAPVEL
jgi:transcriptional regulator with XRE-family HTH domain